MVEYAVVGLASAVIAWLLYHHSALERRVAELESTVSKLQTANPGGFDASVAQMIDELKAAADSACDQVTRRIEDLHRAQVESEVKPTELRCITGKRDGVPVEIVTRLAGEGMSAIDIAKQVGIGPAEVELALRFHRDKSRTFTEPRNIRKAKHYPKNEVVA
ncbi:MAG: hypothetical protein M0T85_13970 [Dehalococcoidales bacterium]|nr:hypothetical protein [Dehalococcoidales bacterium]